MTTARYATSKIKGNPIRFFVKLISVESFESKLKLEPNALPILTGIVMYRQLPKNRRIEVNKMVLAITDGQLKSKLYGLIGQLSFNPYWFTWSLSDTELRDFFESNKDARKVFKTLGLDINTTISVAGLAGFLYGVAKHGASEKIKDVAKKSFTNVAIANVGRNVGLTPKLASTATAILIACTTVLLAQSESNAKSAKKELLKRGLLLEGDL
ncbi:hypothetical protein RJ45_05130 [Photobacterium gaetbulicola]|uniref:Uncharacterized protein n=2 Tax=Photobacterium gaetbulicola TaxID=1295392 RepID=A0A0B9H759_9GAMM|nr:hypothetical protein RJ45_05130 [Photobacterium gaetbulicola]